MVPVRNALSVAMAALAVLLAVLGLTPGIGAVGAATGVACGALLGGAVARSAGNRRVEAFGPADVVTLIRGVLGCGVAALVAESFVREAATGILVSLAAIALVLDAVDGRVARSTRTTSAFGARLDGEADAFLMLVLSVYVARAAGGWVLAVGAVRYVFAVAGWVLPWLRAQLPPRYWRKVVTATAGIALTLAVADIAAQTVTFAALVVSLVLLAESFGSDVWWLWRHRAAGELASVVLATAPVRPPLP